MRLNAEQEIILAEILGKTREYAIAHPDAKLTAAQKQKFNAMNGQLNKGWPLAYVLGYKWFYGNKFKVNQSVLIPRPETEQLVDMAVNWVNKNKPKQIIDIGTGPGTIIISLAKELKSKAKYTAIDISTEALKVAKVNQKTLLGKNKIKFIKGSLLKPLAKRLKNKSRILITANLPYVPKSGMNEPSIKHEPKLALYGGKKAHGIIEKLLREVAALKLSNSMLLLEMNYDQSKPLKKIIKKQLPTATAKIHRDFAKRDRFIEIYLP